MCFELHVSGHILSPLMSEVWSGLHQKRMIKYLNLSEITIDIDCNCLIVIETFAVSKLYKSMSMRRYPKNIEGANCSWTSTVLSPQDVCYMKISTAYVKVSKCIFAGCRKQLKRNT